MGTVLFLSLIFLAIHQSRCECPCMVDNDGFFTCQPHTISQFPEDLQIENCNIDGSMVRYIRMSKQPFTKIKEASFVDFPNLEVINLSYNAIEIVVVGAFTDIPEVHEIDLSHNNIHMIEQSSFDNLIKLSMLDITDNPFTKYLTTAWHFCERTRHGMTIKGDLEVFKDLQPSKTTEEYCNYVKNTPSLPSCSLNETVGVLDCSGKANLAELVCHLQDFNFSRIIYDFPADQVPPFVENYYKGESNGFIVDFNSIKGSENHTRMMEKLSLFNTKFDLSSLQRLTSNRTKEVTIKADTIFMTTPITIDYKLKIHARVVSLNTSISMSMGKEEFLDMQDFDTLEAWAFKEETVSVGRVIMRTRKFGLVEIVDQLPEEVTPSHPGDICRPLFINSTESYLDLTGWFDTTFINLNYVCARTVQSSGLNLQLAAQMANFTLNFAFNAEDVKNRETYMAAQKFKQIMRQADHPDVHMVPSYSLGMVAALAKEMSNSMGHYRDNEISQELQLFNAMGRVQDMQIQFDTIEQQQKMYFDLEQIQLDAMWAATDNSWDFSFDHRNGIEDTISGAMNASSEASFQMQEQEYQELLAAAEANVEHMEEVVEQYSSQLGRLKEMATASMDVMKSISGDLKSKVATLDSEVDKFEIAIHEYEAEQIFRAVVSIFKFFVDVYAGNYVGAAGDIKDIAQQIYEIVILIQEIQEALDAMDFGDLDDVSNDLPTNFKTALQSATDLSKRGPRFDEIMNMARFRMPGMEDITEGKIKTAGVMEACANVADTGHAYTEATAEFANVLLKVADTKDELRVAKADVVRAIEEVERIQQMIIDLERHRDDYQEYMEEAQRKYEEEVNKMKEDYHDMSDELRAEYKANITAKFNEYQEIFKQSRNNYNSQMSRLIESITEKNFGLKKHSINQRGMIMSLYIEFCDAYFYNSFSVCDTTKTPLMSDSFELLLEKLSSVIWDTITSPADIPGIPIEFGPVHIILEDKPDQYKYPISTLKNQSRIDVNLKEWDVHHNFDNFWRVRLNLMRIVLLDGNDHPIQSPGEEFGEEIQTLITFPTIFNDTFIDHESYTFLCQNFFCFADYTTIQDEVNFASSCKVADEFSELNYQPAPDGIFTFDLLNADQIADLDNLAKVKIEFGGSSIKFLGENIEWIY